VSAPASPLDVVIEFLRRDAAMDAQGQAELMSDDYIDEQPNRPPLTGRDAVTQESMQFFEAFPDYRRDYLHVLASGDFVTAHWRMTGTQTGSMGPGTPVTGRPVDLTGCTLFEVHDGQITHSWLFVDRLAMYQQLGLLP